jgi:hypothetical protein
MTAIIVIGALGASALTAGQLPLAVSPGNAISEVLIDTPCPTFSWAAVDGARSYELAIYEVKQDGGEAEAVLVKTLPGAVTAWTPSLEICLKKAGRYGWTVRAEAENGNTEWAATNLFQVAAGPNESEFQQALAIVQSYLAAREEIAGKRREAGTAGVTSQDAAPEPPVEGGVEALVAAQTQLLVTDGDIAVTSTGGDTSNSYVQMDTRWDGEPPAADCDELSEVGRMIYRLNFNFFYVCDDVDGWIDVNETLP